MTKNDKAADNIQVSNSGYLPRIIFILLLFFIIATAVRLVLHKTGQFSSGDTAWSVTLESHLYIPKAGALIKIAPPWDTKHARFYGQSLFHPGMRQRRTKIDHNNRDIMLVTTRAGQLEIEARFDLLVSQVPRVDLKRQSVDKASLTPWLPQNHGDRVETPIVTSILDGIMHDKPEPKAMIDHVFEHVRKRIRITPDGSSEATVVLSDQQGSLLGVNRAMVTLLRAAGLPARVITGLDLAITQEMQPRYWAEVYYQDRWQALEIAGGHRDQLPATFIPLRRGGGLVLEAEGAEVTSSNWRIQPTILPRGLQLSDAPSILNIFDLTRLTPSTSAVLAVLLLLPLGALSTELLRQIVGIRTYGTFTPTLLALAAVYVDWLTATLVFSLVIILGVAGRALLPGLELSRVPRLTVVFTLVAMLMTLVVSLLTYFDPSLDSAVVLLPIVILTTLIDRIYTVADENGLHIALLRLAWAIVAALVSLVILLQSQWGEWLLAYPEVHAVTITVIILLGRYRGKRLTDLRWLEWLREPAKKPVSKQSVSVDQEPGQAGGSK